MEQKLIVASATKSDQEVKIWIRWDRELISLKVVAIAFQYILSGDILLLKPLRRASHKATGHLQTCSNARLLVESGGSVDIQVKTVENIMMADVYCERNFWCLLFRYI